MSAIKMFRVNGYDPVTYDVEVYFKIADDDGYVLCNLCVADDGIYYYKPQSRILTRQENANARSTSNGFVSMENLKGLFEALIKAGLSSEEIVFTARKKGNLVTIERYQGDDQS